MIVLRHYFLEVLALPKSIFKRIMFFVLRDRLTTAQDRAAQDQRAVDRSEFRVDHLSSFTMISGLMHVCMNKMQNIGRNMWGTTDRDDVSLLTLRDLLPNRSNVNLHKHDFYAWLRFLDAVLRSLTITAAMATTISARQRISQLKLNPKMVSGPFALGLLIHFSYRLLTVLKQMVSRQLRATLCLGMPYSWCLTS